MKLIDIIKTTPGLEYHLKHKLPICENIYRYSSESFVNLFAEARELWKTGMLELPLLDVELLETTDIGKWGLYEGVKVPLDLPMLDESGEDTSWTDEEGDTLTLQDILQATQHLPTNNYPTEKLARVVLNWDDNPEEIERVSQVEVSKQYPILIMVDESGNIKWILDGNHRAQKALRSNSKTIPAKLIKSSDLDNRARKILNLNEAEYQGKKVALNKPKRGGPKKFYVYVKNPKTGNVKKVNFGDSGNLTVKLNEPGARASFAARHDCPNKKDKTKPGYWSCNIGRYWKSLGGSKNFSGFW